MTTYESIGDSIGTLQGFLLTDLRRIAEQDIGGNYAATVLISVGCEIFGRLRGWATGAAAGRRFFAEEVVGPRLPRTVSDTVFDALRDGLVHWYDTKTILVDGRGVSVAISWRERPHLHIDRETATFYVNVRDLFQDFAGAIERYGQELREDVALRREFQKRGRKAVSST